MSTRLGQWPDFIVIGAMKAGTTSLYRWLESQPEIWLPDVKEPNFFSDDVRWDRGVQWYQQLFSPPSVGGTLTGEASVSYTLLSRAEIAAERMVRVLPEARLIYLIRHPLDRLRSHYRHEVQRNRETAAFRVALQHHATPYVGPSLYFSCLQPYIQRFGREQICVVRSEDLFAEGPAWKAILDFLRLPDRPPPTSRHNVTEIKRQFSPLLLRLWERGLRRLPRGVPGPARKVAKSLLTREDVNYRSLLQSSLAPIPELVEEQIWDDIQRLESWLDLDDRLWA